MVKNRKTYVCPLIFFEKLKKKIIRAGKVGIFYFLFLNNFLNDRRVFSCYLPFPKVSARNIVYCGQKPEKTDITSMVIN